MNDETQTAERPKTEVVEQRPLTRRDLIEKGMDALDPQKNKLSVGQGALQFSNALDVMEFAKMMAVSGQAVRPDFRGNPGMCMAITFLAIEWRMSPFQIASKSYIVNDNLAFESQLIHAVIEARAPLQGRLRCEYEGEGPNLVCIVEGHFIGETHPHIYRSPVLSKVKKKSPLWVDDPEQQLWYYASRAWARKWAPDVLMGLYTPEEYRDNPRLGQGETPEAVGLTRRLAGSPRADEGHADGRTTAQLDRLGEADKKAPGTILENEPAGEDDAAGLTADEPADDGKGGKKKKVTKKKDAKEPEAEKPAAPTTPAEYKAYAEKWIDEESDPEKAATRWKAERQMREDLAVPGGIKFALQGALSAKHGIEF